MSKSNQVSTLEKLLEQDQGVDPWHEYIDSSQHFLIEIEVLSPINSSLLPTIDTQIEHPKYSLTRDRPRREIQPLGRYAHANYVAYVLAIVENIENMNEPYSFIEEIQSNDSIKWITTMQEEVDVVELLKNKKPIQSKRVFKFKEGILSVEEAGSKAQLVAKRFSQIPGVDYNTFFIVVKHVSIHAILSLTAYHDYELK